MTSQAITPDLAALFAAVHRSPDDDVPRLVLADYLDELGPVRVPCPTCSGYADDRCPRCEGDCRIDQHHDPASDTWRGGKTCHDCKGTGKFPPGYHPERDPASGRNEGGWTNCGTCNDAGGQTPGTVLDDSNQAHAELIRVQVELAGVEKHIPMRSKERLLRARERSIIAAHIDRWRAGVRCEECDEDTHSDCPNCWLTGDAGGLKRKFTYSAFPGSEEFRHPEPVRIEPHGGFFRLLVPTMDDCVERRQFNTGEDWTYRPTPWLAAVCGNEWVEGVLPLECEPYPYQPLEGQCVFSWGGPSEALTGTPHRLPQSVFDLLDGFIRHNGGTDGWKIYAPRELALTALSRAVVQFARNVKGK